MTAAEFMQMAPNRLPVYPCTMEFDDGEKRFAGMGTEVWLVGNILSGLGHVKNDDEAVEMALRRASKVMATIRTERALKS